MKKMNIPKRNFLLGASAAILAGTLSGCGNVGSAKGSESQDTITLANVSYDPTRELYSQYNEIFKTYYKEKTGKTVEITQSHGGSGSQARSVIEGNNADVVTLALAHDVTLIEEAGMIDPGWMDEFEDNSAPYTSTIVFLVRKGNEKNIKDWDDLAKEGVDVITPDPKSSGGAYWNFLASWYYAQKKYDGNEEDMKDFVAKIYKNALVMDASARGSTTTFVENGRGDVLVAWENEALLSLQEYPGKYELITPSVSIRAEPSVAIVDENANKNQTQEAAKEYLGYLYSDEAQMLAGKNFYRPSNNAILAKFGDTFDLDVELCSIDDFGGWDQAYADFFANGAIYDEIYNR